MIDQILNSLSAFGSTVYGAFVFPGEVLFGWLYGCGVHNDANSLCSTPARSSFVHAPRSSTNKATLPAPSPIREQAPYPPTSDNAPSPP